MRETWEALQRSLVRSVDTLDAESLLKEMNKHPRLMQQFDDAGVLLGYLNHAGGDLDEKDAIYGFLVEAAQARGDDAELAVALVWLGLWPALDGIYRRRQRDFFRRPERLVSEIGARFCAAIYGADLGRIRRVAATLVRNVERDVREERKRAWAEERRRTDLPQEQDDDPNDEDATGDRREALVSPLLRTRGVSELGQPPGLSSDEDVEALRDLLVGIVGDDADLVLGSTVYGLSQREVGERLGISHDAARKRFQRAVERIRLRLEYEH
jgi:RNA polymerase sigma-70 factor (ECF subfamily)